MEDGKTVTHGEEIEMHKKSFGKQNSFAFNFPRNIQIF